METYEDVKKILAECRMDGDLEHPEQKIGLDGFPYWQVTNWEEFCNAIKKCSIPTLVDILFKGTGEVIADVYDDFIHHNKKYRWTTENGAEVKFLPTEKITYIRYIDSVGEIIQPCYTCSIKNPTATSCMQCTISSEDVVVTDKALEEITTE